MKAIALIVILLVLTIGIYFGGRAVNNHIATETTIEDSVGSQLAAPQKTEAPDTGHSDIPL